jgi:hypothetical protein
MGGWFGVAQVQSERYDELVFSEPAEAFYNRVGQQRLPVGQPPSTIHHLFPIYDPQPDLQRIAECRRKVSKTSANLASKAAAETGYAI